MLQEEEIDRNCLTKEEKRMDEKKGKGTGSSVHPQPKMSTIAEPERILVMHWSAFAPYFKAAPPASARTSRQHEFPRGVGAGL